MERALSALRPSRWARLGPPILLVAAVGLAFAPALQNDFVNWDDDLNLTNNPSWRGLGPNHLRWMLTTLHGGHYQPLTWLSFAIDHRLWGLDPFGFHLTSVVLHAATALAFYALVIRLLETAPAGGVGGVGLRVAALAGALAFAVHPLRVESVVWVSERRDVLAGLFWVLTILTYLRWQGAGGRSSRWGLVASLGCFTLSLGAKAWAITLPAVLLVLDVYPLGRLRTGRDLGRLVVEKLPWAAIAVAAAGLALLAQRVEAMLTLAEHGVPARIAQSAWGLAFYLWKTAVPTDLSPLYLLERPLDPWAPAHVGAMVLVGLITTLLIAGRRRWPWALAAWACYVIIVSPVLGVVQSGQQKAADRYTYLACLPWAVLVAAGVRALVPGVRAGGVAGGWRVAVLGTLPIVGLGLAVATARQTAVWHDSRTLWDHALRLDPRSYIAATNRGMIRQVRGDWRGALADYERALAVNPGHAEAWNNRGIIRMERGDLRGALADYGRALELKPTYADAHMNRAVVREALGDAAGARADYDAAIGLDPTHARALYGRANLRLAAGDLAGAIADYSAALRHAPDYVEAWHNRGHARSLAGDARGARADYRRALALAPPDWPGRTLIERSLGALDASGGG